MSLNDKKERAQSPFSALTFTQQQEQWRVWRAQRLDYQAVSPPKAAEERPAPEKAKQRAPFRPAPPAHGNLDRVRARLSMAATRTGAYQPTSMG